MSTKNTDQELREFAKKSLKKKRDFKQYLGVYAGVSVLTTGIWAASGAGYYWPIWVMGPWGAAMLIGTLTRRFR